MRDLNFFEGYVEKREFKLDKKLIYFSFLSLFFLSIIGYTIYNSMMIQKEAKIVSSLKLIAENSDALRKVEEIKEQEASVNALGESVDKMKILDTFFNERDKIDEKLFHNINENMPDNMFLTSLSIQKGGISIVGISRDRWSIAEFQKGLQSLYSYKKIFVSHISLENDYYNFTLDITLRGVDENERIDEE